MIRNPANLRPNQLRRVHFPVPEDIFASEDQVAERHENEIRSPAIDRAINDWNFAKEQGNESGLRAAGRAIVSATSAAFRLQGVPLYAHPVLPPQFVKAEASDIAYLPDDYRSESVTALLDMFDPSVRPGGTQQFQQHLAASQGTLDPDSPEARKRADELDRSDPLAAMAHPFAYGGDAGMEDLFGEEGMLGDWGWRRTIPPPSGTLPRMLGEGTRFYLEGGPLTWGRLGRLGRGGGAAAKGGTQSESAASRVERTMARPHTCSVSCHCRPIQAGAQCPPFVTGTGTAPSKAAACKSAKAVANAQVPPGCQKRHCNCRC